MYKVINAFMQNVTLSDSEAVWDRLKSFFSEAEGIARYGITASYQKFFIDVKLSAYTVEAAEALFRRFSSVVSYAYSALYLRFNEGSCVRYRYLTAKEDKQAIYCELQIS